MNGKDVVAVIMAVNKLDGPYFTSEDEDVSAGEPLACPCVHAGHLCPSVLPGPVGGMSAVVRVSFLGSALQARLHVCFFSASPVYLHAHVSVCASRRPAHVVICPAGGPSSRCWTPFPKVRPGHTSERILTPDVTTPVAGFLEVPEFWHIKPEDLPLKLPPQL